MFISRILHLGPQHAHMCGYLHLAPANSRLVSHLSLPLSLNVIKNDPICEICQEI